MSLKNLSILAILLILIGGIYYYLNKKEPFLPTSERLYLPLYLSELSPSMIEIYRPQKSEDSSPEGVVLSKENQNWKIRSFFNAPASEKRINGFFKTLSFLEGQVRSNEPGALKYFSIEDHQALHIVFKDKEEQEIYHLLLGKSGPNLRQTFIRDASSHTVFLAYENLYAQIGMWANPEESNPEPKIWFDLNFMHLNTDKIEKVVIHTPVSDWKLISKKEPLEDTDKKITVWKLKNALGKTLDQEKVKTWIQSLASFRAKTILEPRPAVNEAIPFWMEFFEKEQSVRINFWFLPEEKIVLAKTSGIPTPYQITSYSLQKFLHPSSHWFEMEKIEISKEDINQIQIRHPTRPIEFELLDEKWKTKSEFNGLQVEQEEVETYIQNINNWTPKDVIQNEDLIQKFSGPTKKVLITKKDESLLTIKIGEAIEILGLKTYPLKSSSFETTYLISQEQYDQFFPSFDSWGEVPIISEETIENINGAQITKGSTSFSYEFVENSDQEEPDWYDELIDLFEETEIESRAGLNIQSLPEDSNPIFVELTILESDPIKMAFGRTSGAEPKFLVALENPDAIFEIGPDFYEFLEELKEESQDQGTKETGK